MNRNLHIIYPADTLIQGGTETDIALSCTNESGKIIPMKISQVLLQILDEDPLSIQEINVVDETHNFSTDVIYATKILNPCTEEIVYVAEYINDVLPFTNCCGISGELLEPFEMPLTSYRWDNTTGNSLAIAFYELLTNAPFGSQVQVSADGINWTDLIPVLGDADDIDFQDLIFNFSEVVGQQLRCRAKAGGSGLASDWVTIPTVTNVRNIGFSITDLLDGSYDFERSANPIPGETILKIFHIDEFQTFYKQLSPEQTEDAFVNLNINNFYLYDTDNDITNITYEPVVSPTIEMDEAYVFVKNVTFTTIELSHYSTIPIDFEFPLTIFVVVIWQAFTGSGNNDGGIQLRIISPGIKTAFVDWGDGSAIESIISTTATIYQTFSLDHTYVTTGLHTSYLKFPKGFIQDRLTICCTFTFRALIQIDENLKWFNFAQSNFTQTTFNDLLIMLDNGNLLNGILDISDSSIATPTGTGITAYNNLISKGWTILGIV